MAADGKIAALIAPAAAAARQKSEERLGVEVLGPLPHRRGEETALGNLLADLAREARPRSDVAVLNGGGMRAGLPAGPLRYGGLYEAFPFDNGFATLAHAGGLPGHAPGPQLRALERAGPRSRACACAPAAKAATST